MLTDREELEEEYRIMNNLRNHTVFEYVTVTYRELFNKQFTSGQLCEIEVNPWYISEGGNPSNTRELTYSDWIVLGLPQEEWDRRKETTE